MKKKILIAIIMVVLIILSTTIIKQHHDLSLYEEGFNNIGTYTTEDTERYLVFSDNNIFYTYKQFGHKTEGTYEKTKNPNLYRMKLPEEQVVIYANISKDSLYLIEDDKVTTFTKISDGRENINIKQDE